jgi:periplasmic copper chaperone A
VTAGLRLAAMLLAALPALAAAPTAAPTVQDAWARATPPGTGVAAVYLTLVGGTRADRLLSATTARASMTQIHVAVATDGAVGMRETAALDVPPGATVMLAPHGTHLMLMGLTQPLAAGERFPLTLRFEHAGPVEVSVAVRSPSDPAPTTP